MPILQVQIGEHGYLLDVLLYFPKISVSGILESFLLDLVILLFLKVYSCINYMLTE